MAAELIGRFGKDERVPRAEEDQRLGLTGRGFAGKRHEFFIIGAPYRERSKKGTVLVCVAHRPPAKFVGDPDGCAGRTQPFCRLFTHWASYRDSAFLQSYCVTGGIQIVARGREPNNR